MRVRVLAFARLRELMAGPEETIDLPDGARVRDAWQALAVQHPGLNELSGSTRVARNGRVGSPDDALVEGDVLALLPPVGGG
jgi:MoaE-MoaD fusion protein